MNSCEVDILLAVLCSRYGDKKAATVHYFASCKTILLNYRVFFIKTTHAKKALHNQSFIFFTKIAECCITFNNNILTKPLNKKL